MDAALDTCFLISAPPNEVVRWLRGLGGNGYLRILLDEPGRPCAMEILRHSPTTRGKRERLAKKTSGVIPADVYRVLLKTLEDRQRCRIIKDHTGEVAAPLKQELLKIVEKRNLKRWWEHDRKWVALCQRAKSADIFSADKQFLHVREVLLKRQIGVKTSFGS